MSSLKLLNVALLLGATRWLADLFGQSVGFALPNELVELTAFALAAADVTIDSLVLDDVTRHVGFDVASDVVLDTPTPDDISLLFDWCRLAFDRIVLVTILSRLVRLTVRLLATVGALWRTAADADDNPVVTGTCRRPDISL